MRTVRSWLHLLALLLLCWTMPSIAVAGGRHPLTIDDVLDTVALERVTPSPDGEWVAAVVGRPARPGEAFGRNAYEVDPSRDDVWLVSRRTGERRNLTGGAASAAGYWCATWSPDGQRLAMLSTAPERGEPRGGDNVRLYVWTREAGVRRLGDRAVMTQGRYGSGLYPLDLRGGADGGTIAHSCHDGEDENAGFAWLDNEHLLALVLSDGEVSALLDQYGRPLAESARTRTALLAGVEPTATAVGSGAERMARDERRLYATLTVVDAHTGAATRLADVPTYPIGGGPRSSRRCGRSRRNAGCRCRITRPTGMWKNGSASSTCTQVLPSAGPRCRMRRAIRSSCSPGRPTAGRWHYAPAPRRATRRPRCFSHPPTRRGWSGSARR